MNRAGGFHAAAHGFRAVARFLQQAFPVKRCKLSIPVQHFSIHHRKANIATLRRIDQVGFQIDGWQHVGHIQIQ